MGLKINSDGYDRSGYIKEADGIHGELRFVYRPATAIEFSRVQKKLEDEKTPGRDMIIRAAFVESHLVSWDAELDDGEPATADVKTLLRIPYLVLMELFHIIGGLSASDVDPDANSDAEQDQLDGVIASIESDTPGQKLLEEEVKN